VFDKVQENVNLAGPGGRVTYSDVVNLSMNEVFMRSINTSVTAILPVLSILVIGGNLLGAVTLQEFAIALLVGMLVGVYSSIFIASPILATLKEREPRYAQARRRAVAAGGRSGLTPSGTATLPGDELPEAEEPEPEAVRPRPTAGPAPYRQGPPRGRKKRRKR